MEMSEADIKLSQLQAVFDKAIGTTFGYVGPAELEQCFDGTRDTLGPANMDGAFVRNLGKAHTKLQVTLLFDDNNLCWIINAFLKV